MVQGMPYFFYLSKRKYNYSYTLSPYDTVSLTTTFTKLATNLPNSVNVTSENQLN